MLECTKKNMKHTVCWETKNTVGCLILSYEITVDFLYHIRM